MAGCILGTRPSTKIIKALQNNGQPKNINPYSRIVVIKKESDLSAALNKSNISTLFICSLGTKLDLTYKNKFKKFIKKSLCDRALQTYLVSFEEPFAQELKKMLRPISPVPLNLPPNRISVAVHIRTGEGIDYHHAFKQYFDSNNQHTKYNFIEIEDKPKSKITTIEDNKNSFKISTRIAKSELRFLPKQFYVDQIIKLSQLLGNMPLFVYLFTDAKDSTVLIDEIKSKVNLSNIMWGNSICCNSIVDDFYAMSQFDCLIRPYSNFSVAASLLGNHKIIISPINARWINGNILFVDEINIVVRNLKLNTKKKAIL